MNISISVSDMGALCSQIDDLQKSLVFHVKENNDNRIDNDKLRQENERLKNQEATYISKINSLQKADEHAANLIERGFRKEAELTKELEDTLRIAKRLITRDERRMNNLRNHYGACGVACFDMVSSDSNWKILENLSIEYSDYYRTIGDCLLFGDFYHETTMVRLITETDFHHYHKPSLSAAKTLVKFLKKYWASC